MGEDIFEPNSVTIEKFEKLGCRVILRDDRIFTCAFFQEGQQDPQRLHHEWLCIFPGNGYEAAGQPDHEHYQKLHASPSPCAIEEIEFCPKVLAVYYQSILLKAPDQVIERDEWFIPLVDGEPVPDLCY